MLHIATLWLINEDGDLLLARRSDNKTRDPGLWGPSVTGTMEPGETYDQTLAREVQEELGLAPEAYDPEFLSNMLFDHPDGETREFATYIARIEAASISSFTLAHDEVAEIAWRSIEEINSLLESNDPTILVPSAQMLWRQFFEVLANQRPQVSNI